MQGKLRQRYQVHKEVSRRGYFEGQIDSVNLVRLSDLVVSTEARVNVGFEFLMSDYSIPMVAGRIDADLEIECQRCLQPMKQEMQLEFRLLVDAEDELISESSLDTLYSDEGMIDIFEVVEDEIILALPLVALHENSSCNEHWPTSVETRESVVKDNPFSVLKDLKINH